MSAERAISLNPLNSAVVGFIGMVLAGSGDWERGVPMIRRAMDLNPEHRGLLHIPLFDDHYRKGEYEEALAEAKRTNMPQAVLTLLSIAAAAGQLGRAADARAAFDGLSKTHPACRNADKVRALWAFWLWEEDLIDHLMDGFAKAQGLVASEPRTPSGAKRPTSGSSTLKSPTSGRAASIAVLPFTDMSAAKDQEWFCDGIAEEILNALAQLEGLSVAARASAFSFRGKGDDLRAIGEKLHVTTVLDGSVRRAGDRLRVTVRLSDVANGYQLWSDRYDRGMNDIFDVQEEIAKAVAERLRVGLADDPAALPRVARHTGSQEAYHLYLRGRHHWYARSRGALQKALGYFEEATVKDPAYALPYVGLADLYTVQGIYAYLPEKDLGPKARQSVDRALAINDRLADAYRALGFIQLFFDWDVRAAERNFERSIELDPGSGLSHIWLGWPTWPGRGEVALAAARRAQDLDPLNLYINSLACAIHDFWGAPEEGVRQGQKALDIDPYLIGGVHTRLARHDEALQMLSRAVEVSGKAPFFVSYLAWAQAMAGQSAEARLGLAELEARASTEYVSPLQPAIVYAALGERDRAFELLEESVRSGNCWIACPRLPIFDGLRSDPRFLEHLRRIGHPDVPSEA